LKINKVLGEHNRQGGYTI